MKILMVASEVAPFAKTGGLADVAGALPLALDALGIDVRVVMPGYVFNDYAVDTPVPVLPHIDVTIGDQAYLASVTSTSLPGSDVPAYFINNPAFFGRSGLYQEDGHEYPDNAQRFAFFCKAVLWMIKGLGWIPDVIHCNDWQTALLPVMLKTDPVILNDPELSRIRTMLTIHNLAYQGQFPARTLEKLGLGGELFHPGGLEFYGSLNLLKGGLLYSDMLTTVSPTYASEIQTPEFGAGLDGVLRGRTGDLYGILNGIDYEQWNPETDQYLPANYSKLGNAGKARCKTALQEELGLDIAPQKPLLVMISRLDPQKGFDIFLPLIPDLMKRNVQLAILGTGLPEYHKALTEVAARYDGQLAAVLKFDNGLAHRMEAGADIFLMPSRFEPCGLNQLYSLRYGTIPVVRFTGGLADSVEPVTPDAAQGTGFIFQHYSAPALLESIDDCLLFYSKTAQWGQIRARAMAKDFSWKASAKRYAGLYDELVT